MLILVTDDQFSGVSFDVAALAMPLLQKHGLQPKGNTQKKDKEAELQQGWTCWI